MERGPATICQRGARWQPMSNRASRLKQELHTGPRALKPPLRASKDGPPLAATACQVRGKKRVMNRKRDHGDLPQVFNAALRLLLALTLFTPTTFFEKAARAAAALIAESASPDGAVDMAASK